jgi:hypothetical protein
MGTTKLTDGWPVRFPAAVGMSALLALGVGIGALLPIRPGSSLAAVPSGATTAAVQRPPIAASTPDDRALWIANSLRLEDAGSFIEGLAPVKVDGRWGYIDHSGRMIVAPQFDFGGWFSTGAAAVQVNGRWGYIDKAGVMFIAPQFDQASSFSRGLAPAKMGDLWGYIDRSGRWVIPPRFETANSFYDTLTAVKLDGRWVFIDVTGRIVVDSEVAPAATRT